MDPGRIQALLNPFFTNAPPALLNNISIYIDLLLRWNSRVNLTAVRDEESIVTRHFGESLFAARHLFPGDPPPATRYLDLGSGAGFPGLPIKLWVPSLKTTLIESNQKKATFLREVIRALVINDANVFAARAEDFPASSADLVSLRAVERFEQALPVAARLVRPAGRLALLISSAQLDPARKSLPGFEWQNPLLIPMSASRILLISHRNEPNF